MFYQHKTRGTVYRLTAIATDSDTLKPVVVYSDVDTGMVWTRPASEFFDGRFEVYMPARASGQEAVH